jgi:hypothetical protein
MECLAFGAEKFFSRVKDLTIRRSIKAGDSELKLALVE